MCRTQKLAVRTHNYVAGQVQVILKIQDPVFICHVEITFAGSLSNQNDEMDRACSMRGRD
jgi:hypothetical protein